MSISIQTIRQTVIAYEHGIDFKMLGHGGKTILQDRSIIRVW